jgi:hypothetical protein
MALPPPKRGEIGAFYRVFGPVELSAAVGYTTEKLDELRREVNRIRQAEAERKAAHEIVDAIEEQFKSGSPVRSVVGALLQGLPAAGNIASIGSFLLSCLS